MNVGLDSSPVAGAGRNGLEAPRRDDDQVPRLSYPGKGEKPRIPANFKDVFKELNPDDAASIRFFCQADEENIKALVITFDWLGIEREFSVVEYFDDNIRDLVLEVRLDGDLLAICVEPEETPWFLDRYYLEKEIRQDRRQTFISILRFFTWPLESLAEDLETEGGEG